VLDRLERVTKPTIAQVQGVAAGGGCAIALTCDLRVATPESTFGIPIARTLGNCLSGASYSRLLDLMNPGVVKDLLFTGRFVTAVEAQTLGLVSRLAAPDDIDGVVRDLAAGIAANAPLTVRATKEMIRRLTATRRLGAGDDRDLVELCYTSADFHEGVAAFLAKRKPVWTGR
jgi:enoyl-CoA hydratase/carnithine racemase